MAEKNITAGEPRRISGIEAIFCFFAIEQLKKGNYIHDSRTNRKD